MTYAGKKKNIEEEEKTPVKKMRGQISPPTEQSKDDQPEQGSGSKKRKWKPEIGKMNEMIMNEGNLTKLNFFYDNYDNQKRNLDITVIKYMIKFKNPLINLHGSLPEEIYERLNKSRLRVVEEENKLRDVCIHKYCIIEMMRKWIK